MPRFSKGGVAATTPWLRRTRALHSLALEIFRAYNFFTIRRRTSPNLADSFAGLPEWSRAKARREPESREIRMASITIVTEGGEESHPLGAAAVVLGRGLESDVRLKDIKASRRHCQIVKTPQGFQIVDLSSGNGTFVNGVQVRQQLLAPGDKIQIGSTTLTFTEGAATKPPPRPPPASAFAEAPADKPSPAASPVAATARVAPGRSGEDTAEL